MSRHGRGAFLYLRMRKNALTYWYVRDGARHIPTGFRALDRDDAERFLANYISNKLDRSGSAPPKPEQVRLAAALSQYALDVVPRHQRVDEAIQRLARLREFFQDSACEAVNPATCAAYVRWRTHEGGDARSLRKPVKHSTARRELEDLRAALNHAWKSRLLNLQIPVALPEKGAPRERWLSAAEARRLVLGAKGYVFQKVEGQWKIVARRRDHRMTTEALVRFILIGLRTGTRHDAIMRLAFEMHPDGGHFDFERRLMYRRASGVKETKKRQPPIPIPPKLLVLARYWKRRSRQTLVITPRLANGEVITRRRIDDPFRRAVRNAGLGPDVTPHVLRHTCATWKVQKGVPVWEVAKFLGMTVQMVEEVYGHHAPEHLMRAARA